MIKKLSDLSKVKKNIIKSVLAAAGLAAALFSAFWGMFIMVFSGQIFFAVLVPVTILVYFGLYCCFLFMKKQRKNIFKIALAVTFLTAVISAVRIVYTAYHESIPAVSVMDFDLQNYLPLQGSKRTTLDKPSSVQITKDFPVFDGAVATFPVYGAFAEALNPGLKNEEIVVHADRYHYVEPDVTVICSNTPFAYTNLINGGADIIFVAAPSQKQIKDAETAGKALKLIPIGKEAFVFFVNKDNPVDDLTLLQVRDIYSGRLKNWKDAGGRNEKIKAFQRPEGSGSQTALEKLMETDRLMPAPRRSRPGGMGGIVNSVADYKNYGSAIGFSFRFFLNGMTENKDVKMLKINGVYPSKENIENGTYPLSSYLYAVTAGSKNPNIDKITDWILSPEGQEIVEKTGYTKIK